MRPTVGIERPSDKHRCLPLAGNEGAAGLVLAVPDPGRRLTLDQSMALIRERYGNAIDELGRR